MTYELCTGKTPYEGNTAEEMKKQIQDKEIEYPDTMSSICQDFIASVLSSYDGSNGIAVKEKS